MDWNRLRRRRVTPTKATGAYVSLDELIRIQFRVGDFSFLPKQPVTSILAGRYGSRLRGRGMNFEELRRYQPGDDIRTLDWKVTARTRNPYVRTYTEEKDRAVLLLVDQRINMFFGTKRQFKSVTAAELAAIGAWRSLAVGDRVGAIVFNDSEIVEIAPQQSEQTVMAILGAVTRMNHELSATSAVQPNGPMLNRVLESVRKMATHDLLVIAISDFYGAEPATDRCITTLTSHNDMLALLTYDPSRQHPVNQSLTLSDGTRKVELDLSEKANRARLAADFQREVEERTRFLRKLSAPVFMIFNDRDVVDQVRKILGG